MVWIVVALVLLVALFAGIFIGLRDIPPSGKPHGPMTRNDLLEKTWKSVNDHFARRNRIGR